MREEVKTIRKIVLNDDEKKIISDVATIECSGIYCGNCPLYITDVGHCIKTLLRRTCIENDIKFDW